MLKRAIWTNMGGQTERSEEEEQNLATDFWSVLNMEFPNRAVT
jgi:hypothetical protein